MPTESGTILFPAPEHWEVQPTHGESQEVRTLESLEAVAGTEPSVVALPSKCFTSLPLVASTQEETAIAEIMALRAEKFGITTPGAPHPVSCIDITEKQNGQCTATGTFLTVAIPPPLQIAGASRFEPAIRLTNVPPRALVLSREVGDITLAVGGPDGLTYFQSLGPATVDSALACEIQCILLGLEESGIPHHADRLVFRFPVPESVPEDFSRELGLPVSIEAPPHPDLNARPSGIVPPEVTKARTAGTRIRKIRTFLLAAAAIYLLAALALGTHFFLLQLKVKKLTAQIQASAGEVAEIQRTARRWISVESALDPAMYPIERLFQAARLLPDEGLRLVVFEQRGNDFLISGEASSPGAAVRFNEDLKNSPDWEGFQWSMPQPRILPNNSAQFQITGSRTVPGPPVSNDPI